MSEIRSLTLEDMQALGATTARRGAAAVLKNAMKRRKFGAVRGKGNSGDVDAPAFEVSGTFVFQSYFDDALAEKALLRQSPNQPIVASTLNGGLGTKNPVQVNGYGLGLHPSSETPVAVQFSTGAQQGSSPTYRLRPGQVIWPHGRPGGLTKPGYFSGFNWGLPFGWLGGGSATLVVLRTADAVVTWPTDHIEIVYHRIRLNINTSAEINALISGGKYNGPINWPQRFPWPAAVFGANSLPQGGQPALAIQPTRTALSLRTSSLLAASDMRMYFVGSDPWAQLSTGVIDLTDVRATDIEWGTWSQQAGVMPPFNSAFQTQILTGEAERYAANAGAVVLGAVDAALNDLKVDFVRYGRL